MTVTGDRLTDCDDDADLLVLDADPSDLDIQLVLDQPSCYC